MSIKQAIEAWEDRVQPYYPHNEILSWQEFGTVESAMLAEIKELRAALAALRSMPQGEPVALPRTNSIEASAMIDSVLAGYDWPTNPKNAARAGFEACLKLLATPHTEAWQPIETAPKGGGHDLLIFTNGLCRIGFWDAARGGVWSVWPGREQAHPTHWQPIPEPPVATAARLGVKMGDV